MSTCPQVEVPAVATSPAEVAPAEVGGKRGVLDRLVVPGVRRGLDASGQPAAWHLAALAGRFGEISGSAATASLTFAFRLVFEAQTLGEPAAWICGKQSVFYPPDVVAAGVDLDALVVVRAGDVIRASRVADHLLRSGAFGLVIMDLGSSQLPIPVQNRLGGLAKKHDAALLCLTEKEAHRPSLGSLISLRAQAQRTSRQPPGDLYQCEVRVLKDKRRGPGFKHVELCHGPDGLC